MADPLTALGAAAAASQFVSQALDITVSFYKTFSAIKEAPELVRKDLAEVEQLISISKLVIQNRSLQVDSIASVMRTCLRDITTLQSVLQEISPSIDASKLNKIKKAFVAVLKQDEVARLFARLDREKSNLSLCMHEIDSTLLHAIGINIQAFQSIAGDMNLVVNDTAHNVQTIIDIFSDLTSQTTSIYEKIPELSDHLSSIGDDMIPVLISILRSNHEEAMAAIKGYSLRLEGYFNVPNRRSRHFVGRQNILDKLDEFQSQECQVSKIIVIRGLGGQGKSQVALEYCQQNRNAPFRTMLWIDATTETAIKKQFELLYARFRSQDEDPLQTIEAIVSFLLDIFERMNEPWLIVFDNFDNPEAILNIRDFMPSSKFGTIIFTSRHAAALELATRGCTVELEALSDKAAGNLLFSSAGLKQTDEAQEVVLSIVSKLSNHALAISQAAAYIRKKRLTINEFLSHYSKHLQLVLSQSHLPLSEYQRTLNDEEKATSLSVFTTWELSFTQLKLETEGPGKYKEDLLSILGFSYGRQISGQLLDVFCSNIQPWDSPEAMKEAPGAFLADQLGSWNAEVFSECLSEFYNLGLIEDYERGEDGFYNASLNALIKDWIMLRTSKSQFWEYKTLAIEILLEANNPSTFVVAASSHKLFSKDFLSDLESRVALDTEEGANVREGSITGLLGLQSSLAFAVFDAGHYKESQKLFRRLSTIYSKTYGPSHRETLRIQLKFAESLSEGGKWSEAQPILRSVFEQAVQIEGTTWTFDSISRHVKQSLALNLARLKEYDEALEFYHQILDHAKSVLPSDHYFITHGMMDIADVVKAQGDSESARVTYELLLSTRLPVARDEETERIRASCLLRLARMNSETYDWRSAANYWHEAWDVSKKYRGNQNYETLEALAGLAYTTALRGNTLEAEKMQESVIEGYKAIFEDDNPAVTKQRENLGFILQLGGKLDAAEVQFRCALDAVIQNEGYASEHCLLIVRILACIIRESDSPNRAQETIREHLAHLRPTFGDYQTFHEWAESSMQQMLSLIEVERASV